MANSLRSEVEELGISVSVIQPGFLATAMVDKARDSIDTKSSEEERAAYPHLFTERQVRGFVDGQTMVGSMNGTLAAIEDAVFGTRPRTRYLTSIVGPFPSWLYAWLSRTLSDRTFDYLNWICADYCHVLKFYYDTTKKYIHY